MGDNELSAIPDGQWTVTLLDNELSNCTVCTIVDDTISIIDALAMVQMHNIQTNRWSQYLSSQQHRLV